METLFARSLLGGIVAAAAVTDFYQRRIPNLLTLPAIVAGLAVNTFSGLGFFPALWGLLFALGLFIVFFAVGFMGAGDGKLMGAVGAFIGWPHIVFVIVLISILGAAAGLFVAWRHRALSQTLGSTGGLLADMLHGRWQEVKKQSDYRAPGRLRLPYGVVIAAGTGIFLLFYPR